MAPKITKIEADRVIAEQKIIGGNIRWARIGRAFRLDDILVLCTTSQEILKLRGYVGPRNRSFVLLWKNYPIRKWTVHSRGKLPDGTRIDGPHKHVWDDDLEDEWCYVPTDIRIGNPNEELIDFLRECNIELLGSYRTELFFGQALRPSSGQA